MKKLFLILVVIIASYSYGNAQEIGVRFGSNYGAGGVAIDGIFGLGEFSRIHADVSFFSGGVGIDAVWDFLYRPLGSEAFNWYAGVGPYVTIANSYFGLGVAGEIGIEYRFETVPIALGLDWWPGLNIIEETAFNANSFGLNVRYVFGN